MMDDWDINAFEAAEIGDLETLDKLDRSTISQKTDTQRKSLLHYAAKGGQNHIIVKLAGDCGCNVNAVDDDGSSPLHEAARFGRDDTIHQLLVFGPDTSIVAGIFGTPLHQAAQSGKYAAVHALLEADSSLEAVTVDNATVLHFAALGGNEEVIKDIVKRQPDLLDREDYSGLTPLHYAAGEGSVDAVSCLHSLGASLLICATESGTPLHYAVGCGHYLVAELLLSKGCPVDVTDDDSATSLHWATARGNIDIIKQLAHEWQCNVNAQKKNGCTALHIAAKLGNVGVVQLLVELGADSTIVAADSGTPLHCAALAGHYESSLVLLQGHPPNLLGNLGRTALHSAAQQGHTVLIALLISNGFDVDAEDQDDCTPMHVAAANGHTDAVVELIEHHAIPHKVAGACGTPLHQAAVAGHVETVQEMLKRGCRPDVTSTGGSNALHYAALGGHVEVMHVLADNGCDVNAVNDLDYTPLHIAASYGRSDAVRELVGPLQADKTLVAGQFGAPLHRAAYNGHFECAFNLLDGGHPTGLEDSMGCTPLHRAAGAGNTMLLDLLHSQGHDINAVNHEGVTPLHFAVVSGSAETVQKAIECHANLDAVAGKHGTPLHQAVMKGHEDCARTLMENDCGLDVVASDGEGVLHFAARGGCIPLLYDLVMDKQCNVHAVDEDGFTPLHTAAASGQPEAVVALMNLRSEIKTEAKQCGTAVHVAALLGHLQVLESLAEMGIGLTYKSSNGYTALHFATIRGQVEVVNYLIKQGCDVNVKSNDGSGILHLAAQGGHTPLLYDLVMDKQCNVHAVDEDGFTPLHTAAAYGQPEAVVALMNLRSEIKTEAKQCGTAVHVAALFGRLQVLESLAEMGISLTYKSSNGCSALHFATIRGQVEVVNYLIKQGCNVNAKNNNGSTPLDFAQENSKQEAAQALIGAGAANGSREEKALESSNSDESNEGNPRRFRKLVTVGYSLAADAAFEVGDAVCSIVADKLLKLKSKKERSLTSTVNARYQEQSLLEGECKLVQRGYEAVQIDNDPILSQTVHSNEAYLRIFRVYVSRNAADNGKAVLEGVGLTPEAIRKCYVNNPQNVEEAVQAGLISWSEGHGCTWQVLLNAMMYARIGNHHCKGLRQTLLQIHGQKIKAKNTDQQA